MEEADAIDQVEIEGKRMPSRLRGDCVRDWCSVWNQEWIHTHARDGFKRRGLNNCLSGDDDEELRGTAGQIWRDLDIPAKRKIVVADVERAFNAKELRWDYHFIYGEVLREFPKRGQLDELLDGHDVADAMMDGEDASSEIDEANMDSGDEGDDDSGGQAAEICRQRLVDLRKKHHRLQDLGRLGAGRPRWRRRRTAGNTACGPDSGYFGFAAGDGQRFTYHERPSTAAVGVLQSACGKTTA